MTQDKVTPVSEYDTVEYQRDKMYNSLGVAIACLFALVTLCYFRPTDPIGYLFSLGVVIGFVGFFSHRKYLKELKVKYGLTKNVHYRFQATWYTGRWVVQRKWGIFWITIGSYKEFGDANQHFYQVAGIPELNPHG